MPFISGIFPWDFEFVVPGQVAQSLRAPWMKSEEAANSGIPSDSLERYLNLEPKWPPPRCSDWKKFNNSKPFFVGGLSRPLKFKGSQNRFQEAFCWTVFFHHFPRLISHWHLARCCLVIPRMKLGGGNSNIFYFHPRSLNKWSQFDKYFFKWVETTN